MCNGYSVNKEIKEIRNGAKVHGVYLFNHMLLLLISNLQDSVMCN